MNENFFNSLLLDLKLAEKYKSQGEENKSRVIARQVAGKALKELILKLDIPFNTLTTPYQTLIYAKERPHLFTSILDDLDALTRKVNVDYSFPEDLDLIKSTEKVLKFVKEFDL